MKLTYENKNYIFSDQWFSDDGKEVSEIFSNFLSERAIESGENPSLFSEILTSAKNKVKKRVKPKKVKKKYKVLISL